MTTKFVGDDEGNLKELHTVQIERIVDETGRKVYQPIPGTEKRFRHKWRSSQSVLTDRSRRW